MSELPTVFPESFTTLPEDRFYLSDDNEYVRCERCATNVVELDGGGRDLNTVIRLSHAHLSECREVRDERSD